MRWQPLEQRGEKPVARSSHSITVIGNKAFLFGGEHRPRTPIDAEVHEYDFRSKAWTRLQITGDLPRPRIGHTAAAIGSEIYIFGGRTDKAVGEGSLNELHSFDTASAYWKRVETSGEAPPSRSFHAMTSDGVRYIYVFGGCGERGRLNDLFSFDTELREWKQLRSSDSVQARGGAGLLSTKDSLYVIAGFCGREMDDCHRFDLQSQEWAELESSRDCALPARSVFGVIAESTSDSTNASLLVYGGEVDPSTQGHDGAGGFSSEVFHFSGEKDSGGWKKVSVAGNVPTPRGWFASSPAENGLLIHGGNDESNTRLDDMHLLLLD